VLTEVQVDAVLGVQLPIEPSQLGAQHPLERCGAGSDHGDRSAELARGGRHFRTDPATPDDGDTGRASQAGTQIVGISEAAEVVHAV
jgi:hypothetical protein